MEKEVVVKFHLYLLDQLLVQMVGLRNVREGHDVMEVELELKLEWDEHRSCFRLRAERLGVVERR